jgi:ABC-type amino acid transport substrate-binding protein
MSGFVEVTPRRVLRAGVAMALVMVVTVVGVRGLLFVSVDTTYHRDEALRRMHASRSDSSAVVHREAPPEVPGPAPDGRVLARARQRGTLRVGYDAGNVPFSFLNAEGRLVGFDVELAEQLAESFGLKTEFVPVRWTQLSAMLGNGEIDVMPGMWVRPYWFGSLHLTNPYFTGTVGVVVRDERREEFASVETLRRRRGLRIGLPLDAAQLAFAMKRYFAPSVDFVRFESAGEFFATPHPDIDAFLTPAEGAAAFTLLHPEYTVVVPQPDPVKLPYAFGTALNAEDISDAVNEWIVFATSEGSVARAYDYWILGQGAERKEPRWSILRNVLGWRPSNEWN